MDPATIIARLGMQPHPEGGHYVETHRDPAPAGGRGAVTAIYFLLEAGERSHWHKVDATEIWLWHAGAPLDLLTSLDGRFVRHERLGAQLARGEHPQAVVPKDAWQAAEARDGWALVSCVVAPAFRFEGFTLAAPGWAPRG
jgi:uncharacterized protein